MSEDVTVVVRIPIQQLADDVRSRHKLTEQLSDVRLDADSLVLSFKLTSRKPAASGEQSTGSGASIVKIGNLERIPQTKASFRDPISGSNRRRRRSKRNRMKTRGWQVVAKIVNSKGQTAIVYRPFVSALFGKQLTGPQQRAAVAEILRSNGNNPTEASIDYFLTNTIEYLAQVNKREVGA